jgi:hypothetical protein
VHGSLEEPAAKLRWAATQYQLIRNDLGGYDHPPVDLRVESSADGLTHRFYAVHVDPLPSELSLRLGDAYHDLRCTLDYVVYQLHARHYRGRIPVEVARQSQFPVYQTVPVTGAARTPRPTSTWPGIKELGKRERESIERLQPYRSNRGINKQLTEALADITDINNIDKHRQLFVTRTLPYAVPSMASTPDYGLKQSPAFGLPITTGSLVDTWTFERRPPAPSIARTRRCLSGITFDLNGQKIDVLPHLGGSVLAAERVLRRFSSLFPPLAEPRDFSWVRLLNPPT